MTRKNKIIYPRFLTTVPIHPFLLSAYFILFMYVHNLGELSPKEVFAPLGLVVIVALVAVYILRTIFKSFVKAGLFYSAFLTLFFSYGYFQSFLHRTFLGNHYVLSALFIALLLWLAYHLIKTAHTAQGINHALNITAAVLVLLVLFQIVRYEMLQSKLQKLDTTAVESKQPNFTQADHNSPDIYYLIFDSYPREDVFKKHYDFNNRRFIDKLKYLGFYIARNSLSNYAITSLSIASSLNMTHLIEFAETVGENATGQNIPDKMFQQSNVHEYLRERGYKVNHFASRWGPTDKNLYADKVFRKAETFSGEFISILINTSWLRLLDWSVYEQDTRKQIRYSLSELKKIPEDPEPTFTFAHILIPHTIFFDKDGHSVRLEPEGTTDEKELYLDQLAFVNKQILEIVGEIIARSSVKPIIVIQSDHGPQIELNEAEDNKKEIMKARHSILNAIYFPDNSARSAIYTSITPVNTFRMLFNTFFDDDFDYLIDQNYYSTYDRPYKFTELKKYPITPKRLQKAAEIHG